MTKPMALGRGAIGRELVASIRLGTFFATPIRSLLFLLFVPRAPQLEVATPLTSFLVSLAVYVIATVLARVFVRVCSQVKQVGFGLHDPQHGERN